MSPLRLFHLTAVILLSMPNLATPQNPQSVPVHLERTRAIRSPEGGQTIVAEHVQPLDEDGQRDAYNGELRLRVISQEDGTSVSRSRTIEAPRITTVRAPQWLDGRWAVVEFGISRASRGVAYLDTATGRVIQLEIVAATGRRGSGTPGQRPPQGALSNFEVIDSMPDGTQRRIACLAHGQSSIFPIYLPAVPASGDAGKLRADGSTPLDDILMGIEAWDRAMATFDLPAAAIDQASESVSPDGKRISLLLCTQRGPRLILVPLGVGDAHALFGNMGVVALSNSIRLNCAAVPGDETTGVSGDSRFTTEWSANNVLLVVRETFSSESDSAIRAPVLEATLTGGEITLKNLHGGKR